MDKDTEERINKDVRDIREEIARIFERITIHNIQEVKWHDEFLKLRDEDNLWKDDITDKLEKLKPIQELFTSAVGFDKISVWILKALVAVGAGVGVIYAFLKWLKS